MAKPVLACVLPDRVSLSQCCKAVTNLQGYRVHVLLPEPWRRCAHERAPVSVR